MAKRSTPLDREQRLCLALHLSMDDMQARLSSLAQQGRSADCLALCKSWAIGWPWAGVRWLR
ncbi:MAG: hypothetical protein VW834_00005, partial [Synechococcus sp.]